MDNKWEQSPSRVLFLFNVQWAFEKGAPNRVGPAGFGPKAQLRIRSEAGGGVTSGVANWLGEGVQGAAAAGGAVDVDEGDDADRAPTVVGSTSKVAFDGTIPSIIYSVEMPMEDRVVDPNDMCRATGVGEGVSWWNSFCCLCGSNQ